MRGNERSRSDPSHESWTPATHACTESPFPLRLSVYLSPVSSKEHGTRFVYLALGPELPYILSTEAAFTALFFLLKPGKTHSPLDSGLRKLTHLKGLLLTFACTGSLWPGLRCCSRRMPRPPLATRGEPRQLVGWGVRVLSMTDTCWCCWPSSSTCWFYAQRAELLHCNSPISLLISSFPLKPTVKSEVRFKINMEALRATLVWTIWSGTGFHLKWTLLGVTSLNYIDDGLLGQEGL